MGIQRKRACSPDVISASKKIGSLQHISGELLQIDARAAHPNDYPRNLWSLLQQAASDHPTKGIGFREAGLSSEPTKMTYAELLQQAADRGTALLELGLVHCARPVVVFFERPKDLVLWTWSVIASGAIPAILPPLSNDSKTQQGQLENLATLFGSPTVLTHRKHFETFASVPSFLLQDAGNIKLGHGNISSMQGSLASPGDIAVLLFTSGSTGRAKAVETRHGQLIASVQGKQKMHNLSTDTNFMAWISLDHSANFCELHVNAICSGSDQFHVPPLDVVEDPSIFWELLSVDKIGYSFSPNSFLSKATKDFESREKRPSLDLSALRVIMVAGEANLTATLDKADKLGRQYGAPKNFIKAAYGLSETCSACFYNLQSPWYDLACQNVFSSVGKHISPGLELRVVDEHLDSAPLGQQGAIQLRGEIVFGGYYNNQVATKDCMTTDGWFKTGDLGSLDEKKNLKIVGRTKEILILNGNNYSSFELEHAIDFHVGDSTTSSYIASFAAWDNATESEGAVILFNPSDGIALNREKVAKTIKAIRQACVRFCSKPPIDVVPLPRSEMPKSTIGKLSRQQLKTHYTSGLFEKYRIEVPDEGHTEYMSTSALETEIRRKIAEVLSKETGIHVSEIVVSTSLFRTGVDSLTYLRIKKKIEDSLGLSSEMPMALLLNASTVGELSRVLTKELENPHYSLADLGDADYDPIVTLRGSGSRTPIFLVHPGGGEFLIWLSLLEHMPDRPMYAFRVRGFHSSESTFASFDDLLDCYEAAVLRVQPHGPYAFMGLCFGGAIGFELTKRLESQGKEVKFCGGIDNPPQLGDIGSDRGFKHFLLQLMAFHGLFSIDDISLLEDRYEDIPDDDEDFYYRICQDFDSGTLEDAGLTHSKIESWRRIFLNTCSMLLTYRAEGKVRRYDVFHVPPLDRRLWSDDEWAKLIREWDQYGDSVKYHQVTGNHFTVLNHPHLEVFQRSLNRALADAGI
uniref:Putative NRPS n=1 Tax=Cladonia uncialis subsp. uncialis TaxID=180999 RepID=A0A1Z1C4T8_CLAUC|nr:putative non-ribosomal peptide synthetase [Cladonia uncialis subsp. uncialis]AUW30760.1 putative NRPS [Cladonia uncialis subsp. uncialis]